MPNGDGGLDRKKSPFYVVSEKPKPKVIESDDNEPTVIFGDSEPSSPERLDDIEAVKGRVEAMAEEVQQAVQAEETQIAANQERLQHVAAERGPEAKGFLAWATAGLTKLAGQVRGVFESAGKIQDIAAEAEKISSSEATPNPDPDISLPADVWLEAKESKQEAFLRKSAEECETARDQAQWYVENAEHVSLRNIFDTLKAAQTYVNYKFLKQPPGEMYAHLRSGVEHPRWIVDIYFAQHAAKKNKEPIPNREDLMVRAAVPPALKKAYLTLARWEGTSDFAKEARRIASQIENRCYEDAAVSLETSSETSLHAFAEVVRAQEEVENQRYDAMREKQTECYKALLSAPENRGRREMIESRMRTEEIFEKGELVGSLLGLDDKPYDGEGPAVGTFKYGTETRRAIVKMEYYERSTRPGVTPGTGPLREAAISLPYIAAGFDKIPAIVPRRGLRTGEAEGSVDLGDATLVEFVPGSSIDHQLKESWFMQFGEPHPDLFMIRLVDEVVHRTDGGPRNLMMTEDGSLAPIDFGSEGLPNPESLLQASVARWILQSLNRLDTPPEVQTQFRKFAASKAFQVFLEATNLFPESMEKYQKNARDKADQLSRDFARKGQNAEMEQVTMAPKRMEVDFGSTFLVDFQEVYQRIQAESSSAAA